MRKNTKMMRAKYDMNTVDGLRWTKGKLYIVEENEEDFGLEADNSFIYYINKVKTAVLEGFKEV